MSTTEYALPQTTSAVEAAALRWKDRERQGRKADADRIAERIVQALRPMIGKLCQPYLSHHPQTHLDAVANAAICTAIQTYKPATATSFCSYVYSAITQQLAMFAGRDNRSVISEPRDLRKKRTKVRQAKELLPPGATGEQVATAAGVSTEDYQRIQKSESVFAPVADIAAPGLEAVGAVTFTSAADARMLLDKYLPQLSEIQQTVLTRRFFDGDSLQVIAGDLGICRERTRQIECQALAKLRALMS